MKLHRRTLITVALGLLKLRAAHATTLQSYQPGSWPELLQQYKDKPWIAHFWGVSCAPCIHELPQWSNVLKRYPDMPVVFIQTDPVPEKVTLHHLEMAGLDKVMSRVASSTFDEYTRYEVDPKWMGELPATFLIDKRGRQKHLRGSNQIEQIERWIAKN